MHGDQRGQRLVGDLDRFRAQPGRLQRLAEHPADRVTVVHDLAGEQRLVVFLAGVVEAGHVACGQHPHHAGHQVGALRPQPGEAGVRVRDLDRPGVQGAQRAAGQVLSVERAPGHVLFRALMRHRLAHHGPVRAVGQRPVSLAHGRASLLHGFARRTSAASCAASRSGRPGWPGDRSSACRPGPVPPRPSRPPRASTAARSAPPPRPARAVAWPPHRPARSASRRPCRRHPVAARRRRRRSRCRRTGAWPSCGTR